jgi:hypothetical protein
MKTLALILLTSTLATAQVRDPFKDANTIIFETQLSDSAAFAKICWALVDHGYPMKILNKDFYQVRTDIKITESGAKYFLIVNVDDGRIIVQPVLKDEKLGYYYWEYRRSPLSFDNDVYREIMKYFSGLGTVMYAKR